MMKYLKIYEAFNRDEALRVANSNIGDILPESDIYQYVQYLHRNPEDFHDGDLSDRIEKFKKYELQEVNLSDFDLTEWQLDEDMIDDFINKFKKYGKYPPPVVDFDPDQIYNTIIDGIHRMNALDRVGLKRIKAWVGKNK